MKRLSYSYIVTVVCCILATSCEIDNYDGPDATIQGALYDHNGQPLQVNHGSGYIRMREINWPKGDTTIFITNQTLAVQQDGTYQHIKWFAGEYRMLPYAGNFYPYDDDNQDADDAGELVNISGVTTKDFTVTPYLTIEWVKKPTITADKYLECTVRFKRNQKGGYEMPNLREGVMKVSRVVNTNQYDGILFPAAMPLTNAMEGQDIVLRTDIPLYYTGIDYWVRVCMNCQTVPGNPDTNYPGIGAQNCTTIEKIFVP